MINIRGLFIRLNAALQKQNNFWMLRKLILYLEFKNVGSPETIKRNFSQKTRFLMYSKQIKCYSPRKFNKLELLILICNSIFLPLLN